MSVGRATQPAQLRRQRQRRRAGRYSQPPQELLGATEFSDDSELSDPVWMIRALKQHPEIWDELERALDLSKHFGRKRIPGSWGLIMVAFVLSGEVDIETFCNRYANSPIWQEAGFPHGADGRAIPCSVQTAHSRMTELEPFAEEVIKAANKLIQRATSHEPRIKQHVWVDATGFETHARLEHCCPTREECRALGGRVAKMPRRAHLDEVADHRHEESVEAPTDRPVDALEQVDTPQGMPAAEPGAGESGRRRRPYRYWRDSRGHLYRTLDPEAGCRKYATKRYWMGGYGQVAVSVFLQAPVAINCFSANENETSHYEELMAKAEEAMGARPEAVAADRAYSINSVFEYNTRRDIATVAPWRKTVGHTERRAADAERWDRHGVPRCPACGGPGDTQGPGLRLYFARGEPRLRFKCELRIIPECERTYSIACSENWRMLVPMSRLSEPYHALKKISKNRERVFRHWRDRYSVFGNNFDLRPKRCGIAWQNLRASFALLIEWFRLCARYGWLGSARRSSEYRVEEIHGASILHKVLRSRMWHALNLPYGQAAYRLGLAPDANPPPEPEPRMRA